MLRETYPYYLANKARQPNTDLEVIHKYTGETATRTALADASALDQAISAAQKAAEPMRRMPAYERQEVLQHVLSMVRDRQEELAQALTIEAGKPIRYSRGEATRLTDTLRIAAEESVRINGEVMPLDISARAQGYEGMWKHVPVGPCGLITPWNFPLNLVAHKVGPALAAGCPFVLKPASDTPVGALILGEALSQADLPEGAFSVLPMHTDQASALVEDERLKLLSFTGSAEVGWSLKQRAGKKKVALELGGNAGVIIDASVDLDDAVQRVVFGTFYQAGQSCISVQRIYVHADVYDRFREKLLAATRELSTGDPSDDQTFIGPIISESAAQRIEQWVHEAVEQGATLLCGGNRKGKIFDATLLENVPAEVNLSREEVFGPVGFLERFDDFGAALEAVNDSRYGLQAGVFTRDLHHAHQAWDELEVGGVMINEVPSWRVDHMPYGGVKDSGLGREGLRWSIREMMETRLMVLRTPGSVVAERAGRGAEMGSTYGE